MRRRAHGLGSQLRHPVRLRTASPPRRRCFAKSHSYGEFVFDFGWAQAYSRLGREYYPKLSIAVPFTPATGPRLLVRPELDAGADDRAAAESHRGVRRRHMRFPPRTRCFSTSPAREACERAGWLLRRDCQFHWTNRGYADLRRLPRDLHGREAQEGAPRAPPCRRSGRHASTRTWAPNWTPARSTASTPSTATRSCATATSPT